ncbi:putative leucine-rich repeat-containing protein DDB_G0290503 [Argopecten irradians]|uniref:putative leucine-rich repeat-containing protein DDB_G0290503 n=1 Tax=Argopecten irradians TaxID=31199 RepID=UPI0037107B28
MKEINDLKVKLTELKPRNTSRKIQRRDMKLDKMEAKLKQKEQQIDVKNREFLNQQQQIDQLETELATLRKEKLNLQKAKSYYKQKGERVKQKDVDKTLVKEMKETIKTLESENAVLREQVDEALEGHKKISVFHNGKYDDAIRLVYIDLLQMGVSIKNCQNVVKSVLSNLMHVEIDRLPQKTLATLLTVEAQILAQAQAAEEILQCENATLHLDGTKKHFEEYSGFQISVGGGRSFSLGHQLMATGDTDSYIEATVNTVEELASALTDDENEKKTYVANLMMKIKNLMTDRHIVNKCYQHKFENLRKQYGEEIIDNWDTLTEDEKNKTAEVNGLFCGLHVIINMASASLKGLKEFEDHNEIVNNYNQQSAASELIRACAKAFMVTSGDEKSGDALEFKHFLDSMEQKFHFITFKHNRFNVLFHDAGAMYFHCKHVLEYLSSGRTSKCNKLLTAIHNGCENERILSECRALGLVGKLICGPLWRLLEDQNTSFFEMNEHWLQLKVFLEQYQQHPEDLLKGNQTFRGASIDKDEVYEKLIEPNAQYDKPTLEAIQSICRAMLPVITRQLEDQLPGGKYDNPSADLVQETSTAPLTNRLSEADFSDLDRSVNQAPQKGKASRSGTICYKRNKTKEYLKTLTKSKKEKYMKIARNLAKERAAQDGVKTLAVRKQRLLLQAKRIEKKEAAKQKKAERENNIREKLECEGVWTSYNIVSERLDGLSRTKKVQKIKDQILGHKLILKSNISDKSLFSWTKNKRNLTVAELQENLVAIINEVFQTHIPDTVHAINSIAPSAPVHTVQKRQMKRVCTHSKSAKSKKIKTVAVEKFKTGTFYAVAFENTWYPGECIQIESDTEATLKYLTHKGSLFQWPSREDVMVTNIKAVLCETEISPVCGGRLWNVTNKSEISSIFKDH